MMYCKLSHIGLKKPKNMIKTDAFYPVHGRPRVTSHFYFGGKKIERINYGLLLYKPQTKLQKE